MVSLYDANKYVIKYFTKETQESFVTCLPSTAGPQIPRWFISHWWGESVSGFIQCLKQFIKDFDRNYDDKDERRGGGMTANTPIWVCAYGNNQWALGDDIPDNPRHSDFTKATRAANGRIISILGNGGIVFARIWCAYELFLTLINTNQGDNNEEKTTGGVWAVCTVHSHIYEEKREAVGIISGGATSHLYNGDYSLFSTEYREKYFPFALIARSL